MSQSSDRYVPIDCNVHDQLLERATLRRPTTVEFHDEGQGRSVVQDVIVDVFSREGAEYMRLGSGKEIRLDKIVSFGDEPGLADGPDRSGRT